MDQQDKNLLKKNLNDWAIFSIINNTKLCDKPVIGWKIIAENKVTVDVRFHIIRKFREEIVVRANNKSEKETLVNLATGGQKLNFYLPDDLVLFQTEVKHVESNGDLRIKFPKMIAQIDRRKDLRLFLDEAKNVRVEFGKVDHSQKKISMNFTKSCFDISGSGCSFVVKKSEKHFFRKSDIVSNLKITLGHEELFCDAYVVNMAEERPNDHNELFYEGWKISLKFKLRSEDDKKIIEKFVFKYADFSEVI